MKSFCRPNRDEVFDAVMSSSFAVLPDDQCRTHSKMCRRAPAETDLSMMVAGSPCVGAPFDLMNIL